MSSDEALLNLTQVRASLQLAQQVATPAGVAQIKVALEKLDQTRALLAADTVTETNAAAQISNLLAQLRSVQKLQQIKAPNTPVLRSGTDVTTETLFLRVDGTAVEGDAWSDYQVGKWMTDLRNTRLWAGLLTGAPSSAQDILVLEVGGSVYRRPELSLRTANPRLLVTNTATAFVGIPEQTTVYAMAVLDDPYNGNLIGYFPLPAPRPFPLGGQYVIPAGELFLGFQ